MRGGEALGEKQERNTEDGSLTAGGVVVLRVVKTGPPDQGHTSYDHREGDKMVPILLPLQEDHGKDRRDYNDGPAHHLIHGSGTLRQCHKHQRRSRAIESRRYREQERINIPFQLRFFRDSGSRRRRVRQLLVLRVHGLIHLISLPLKITLLAKVDKEAAEFAKEHVGALEVGMRENAVLIFICATNLKVVLVLHHDRVRRAEQHHQYHYRVQETL